MANEFMVLNEQQSFSIIYEEDHFGYQNMAPDGY